MWHMDGPLKVFKCHISNTEDAFNFSCIMRTEKFDSFHESDKVAVIANKNISVADIKIKDPDNPANLLDAKLIQFKSN